MKQPTTVSTKPNSFILTVAKFSSPKFKYFFATRLPSKISKHPISRIMLPINFSHINFTSYQKVAPIKRTTLISCYHLNL